MIRYQLTKDVFFALQKNFIENSDYHKRRSTIYTILLMIITALFGFLLAILLLPRTISAPLIIALGVCIGVFSALLLSPLFKKLYLKMTLGQIRYMLKQESKWPRDVTLYINETGIERDSLYNDVNKRLQVAWEAIEKVSEDESNHYLYVEAREVIIVPKQNRLLSETEQSKINLLLQNNLSITL